MFFECRFSMDYFAMYYVKQEWLHLYKENTNTLFFLGFGVECNFVPQRISGKRSNQMRQTPTAPASYEAPRRLKLEPDAGTEVENTSKPFPYIGCLGEKCASDIKYNEQ